LFDGVALDVCVGDQRRVLPAELESFVFRVVGGADEGGVGVSLAVVTIRLKPGCFKVITEKFLRTGLAVLAVSMVGIMSLLVLFTGDLFPGALP